MAKAILLLLVVGVLYWFFFGRRGETPPSAGKSRSRKVVSCDYCRLHVPEEEAVRAAGRSYCCEEHRRLDES